MAQPRPIGMRIPRPYDTEEDFIRGDGLAIGRLGMILIGAPKRPPGITIRFEVVLRNDQPVFRGEGRVVAHRVHGNGREGLEIRFTRLDSRSKALVEQVLKLRRSGALTPLSATTPLPEPEEEAPPSDTEVGLKPPELAAPSEKPEVQAPPEPTEEILDSSELAPVESERLEEAEDVSLESAEAPEVRSVEAPVPPVQTEDDAAVASAEPVELPVEEPEEEPLDEDPTPFAPPVMLDQFEAEEPATEQTNVLPPQPPASQVPRVAVEVSQDVAAALSKLRQRAGAFDRPESASSLLDRLRERSKSD